MSKLAQLQDTIVAAGIPITRLCEERPRVVTLSPLDELTDEQRSQAEAMIAAFDWSDPPPLKPAATLQEMFLAAPAEARQAFWDLCVGDMLLEWAAVNPERAAKHAETCGFNVDLREGE